MEKKRWAISLNKFPYLENLLWRNEEKIFILPTKSGPYYAGVLFIMFVISLSYGHSLAYATSFTFFSLIVISSISTNYNLSGVRIGEVYDCISESGKDTEVKLTLENVSRKDRFHILVKVVVNGKEYFSSPVDLSSGEKKSVTLGLPTMNRGVYKISRFNLTSTYPFGIFKSWKNFKREIKIYVSPRPSSWRDLPLRDSDSNEGFHNIPIKTGDTFWGHRVYQQGEGWHGIDWKAYARGKGLYKKIYHSSDLQEVCIYYKYIPKHETEAILSEIAGWIEKSEVTGLNYSMQIPDTKVLTAGRGIEQMTLAKKYLASFNSEVQHL